MSSPSSPFTTAVAPDWQAFLRCLRREGTPQRVHFVELLLDEEIKEVVAQRFHLVDGIEPGEPFYAQKREIRINRFLGYDFVCCGLDEIEMPIGCFLRPGYGFPFAPAAGNTSTNIEGQSLRGKNLKPIPGPIRKRQVPRNSSGTKKICPETCASWPLAGFLSQPDI